MSWTATRISMARKCQAHYHQAGPGLMKTKPRFQKTLIRVRRISEPVSAPEESSDGAPALLSVASKFIFIKGSNEDPANKSHMIDVADRKLTHKDASDSESWRQIGAV